MNSRQYARIEKLLEQAERVTDEHPLVTIQGNRIKSEVHELLQRVTTERIRTELEESAASDGRAAAGGTRDVRVELLSRAWEYERILASLEGMNAHLRKRRRGAADAVMDYYDTHIALNERTMTTMRAGLDIVRKQLALADGARPPKASKSA
jgi:hypothetical protein